MTLTLAMLRCPDNVAPETRTVSGGEFSIGRGPENDWVLADPERGLSKRHCVLGFRGGVWQIADFSTNGTFVNREGEPIGRGQLHELRDGDRLRFGAYEIEVHIDAAAPGQRPAAPSDPFAQRRATPAPELFALDPFAAPPGRAPGGMTAADPLFGSGSGDDPFSGLGAASVSLPPDYDPLAPDPVDREFRGPVQSDHTPAIEDAFSPPAARSVLPEDWDRELHPQGAVLPTARPQPVVAEPAPPPIRVRPAAPVAAAPAPPIEAFTLEVVAPEPVRSASPPAPTLTAAAAAVPARSQPQAGPDLLAAFLRGAGLADVRPADPVAAMEALGAAFRAVVGGLRQAMIARAAIKGEFRIEQTIIRSRGNNPLKFSADDEDALGALIGTGRHSDMDAVTAVTDALRDIRLHELASVAAMQSAVRALLAELDPAKLRQTAERSALRVMTGQRKADAWDAFEALHARITQALMDDFDSVFGKAFARAYERAVAEIAAREPGAP